MKSGVRVFALAGAVALAVTACSSSGGGASSGSNSPSGGGSSPGTSAATTGSSGGSNGGTITVGLSLPSSVNGFYTGLAAGVKAEAQKLNVKLETAYAENSPATQATQIRAFVASGVDAILVSPSDPTSLATAYAAAQQKNIPIMSMANDIADPSKEDAFIGADWGKYGHDIGVWTCQHFKGGSGEVGLILGPAGLSYVAQMADPYKAYLKASCPKLKIVFSQNLDDATAADALPVAQDALTAHPNMDVIFAGNDLIAAGAIQAIAKAGKSGKVMVTGFDGDPIGLQNVDNGSQAMTIDLDPLSWGSLALQTLVADVHGKKPAQHLVPIQTKLLDQSNIKQFCAQTKCTSS